MGGWDNKIGKFSDATTVATESETNLIEYAAHTSSESALHSTLHGIKAVTTFLGKDAGRYADGLDALGLVGSALSIVS